MILSNPYLIETSSRYWFTKKFHKKKSRKEISSRATYEWNAPVKSVTRSSHFFLRFFLVGVPPRSGKKLSFWKRDKKIRSLAERVSLRNSYEWDSESFKLSRRVTHAPVPRLQEKNIQTRRTNNEAFRDWYSQLSLTAFKTRLNFSLSKCQTDRDVVFLKRYLTFDYSEGSFEPEWKF